MNVPTEKEQLLRELVLVFLEENQNINLSAFRTEKSCWIGNIQDSLAFLEILHTLSILNSSFSILDVGTGGGFPLLPLAICLPDAKLTGLDATEKKIRSIERIAQKLNLKNVKLLVGRTEELGRNETLREQFDIVTARALAELPVLLEYTSPFVKVGGHIVCWKSVTIDEELQQSILARAEFSCHLKLQHRYTLPNPYGERQLLVFEKLAKLNDKYPRTIGIPSKHPLI